MLSIINKTKKNKNTCEDGYKVIENQDLLFGIVMDGCSTGINSSWVVQTIIYIFNNIIKYCKFSPEDYFLLVLLSKIKEISNLLHLNSDNLLTTLIIFQYNKKSKVLEIRTFGDCVYYVNDIEYVVDQNNTPDYFAYHLNNEEEFFNKYPTTLYENVDKFIICTDGIDKINIWIGAKLMNVFCVGNKAEIFSYATSVTVKWNDVTKWFWSKYLEVGKKIYDLPEWHSIVQ